MTEKTQIKEKQRLPIEGIQGGGVKEFVTLYRKPHWGLNCLCEVTLGKGSVLKYMITYYNGKKLAIGVNSGLSLC